MDLDQIRTSNFLEILRTKYRNSPKEFEVATGYRANMVSQLLNGHKPVRDKLARKLEKLMKLPMGELDKTDRLPVQQPPQKALHWPFSVPPGVYEGLSPKAQREIDEAFTKLVIGAQAQEILNKQKRRG